MSCNPKYGGIKKAFITDIYWLLTDEQSNWQKIFKKHKRDLIKAKIKKLYNL